MPQPALLFDFGGTLDADGLPWVDRFHALYLAAGGALEGDRFGKAFGEADRRLADLPDVASLNYTDTAHATARLLADLVPDIPHRWHSVAQQFALDAIVVARRNREVLAGLSSRYPLGVVSNYQGNLLPCLEELGLHDLFSVAIDSGNIGFRKPEPAMFARALGMLDSPATGSWMVGDSPINDMQAAASAGLRTCWIAPAARRDIDLPVDARIARLDELPAALKASCRH